LFAKGSVSSIRRAMRFSLADALFYALMVGSGEVYFLADAVRLGATALEQALVITLPLCVGTLGPLLALGLLGLSAVISSLGVVRNCARLGPRSWSTQVEVARSESRCNQP